MEEKQLFRKTVMDRLSSPEELNDYLHVTRPSVWIALIAVVIILIGALVWSTVTYINSYVSGTAEVKDGVMTIALERDAPFAEQIAVGQEAFVGDTVMILASVGYRDGGIIATAPSELPDGSYPVKIKFSQTRLLEMIFN